jgi:BirA family biotin operon repressor/biotin-[acetyl-CoA-carboxylase] ligase
MTPPAPPDTPITDWPDRLEAACAGCPRLGLTHVRVLAETDSTQDAAWAASAGNPGWLVLAGRQVAGRGRLGRAWADTADKGLAMTLTIPAGALSPIAVGVALCRAIQYTLQPAIPHTAPAAAVGLRWPNDVVERAQGRKLAGVLIEARDGVALVGIGVNVRQGLGDFPPGLRTPPVSIAQLGANADRLATACAILAQLDHIAAADPYTIAREAALLDTIVGTSRRVACNGREFAGKVVALTPDGSIDLELPGGQTISLPAGTTSLIHE